MWRGYRHRRGDPGSISRSQWRQEKYSLRMAQFNLGMATITFRHREDRRALSRTKIIRTITWPRSMLLARAHSAEYFVFHNRAHPWISAVIAAVLTLLDVSL